jgi:hypothetical protein
MIISLVLTVAALLLSRFPGGYFLCGRWSQSFAELLVGAYIAPILSLVYVTTFSVIAAAGRALALLPPQHHHLLAAVTKRPWVRRLNSTVCLLTVLLLWR